ncbi:MAG: AAA family ATPase, partial [Jiangellales bacterium]
MITELRIRHLGVIEDAELLLGDGLTVLTGETGAGKTMVLTALGLLLGGRADAAAVRADAERAEVEGLLDVRGLDDVRRRAADAGAAVDDDQLVIGRSVAAGGRSRALLGGRTVPTSVLVEIADDVVAVHGQSSQVALVRADRQRRLLDTYGGAALLEHAAEVARLHARLGQVEAELDHIRTQGRERAREADLLRHGLAEIEQVDPRPGEEESLLAEQARLSHADRLRDAVALARAALAGADDGATAG